MIVYHYNEHETCNPNVRRASITFLIHLKPNSPLFLKLWQLKIKFWTLNKLGNLKFKSSSIFGKYSVKMFLPFPPALPKHGGRDISSCCGLVSQDIVSYPLGSSPSAYWLQHVNCEERADGDVQTGGAGNSQSQVTTDRNLAALLIFWEQKNLFLYNLVIFKCWLTIKKKKKRICAEYVKPIWRLLLVPRMPVHSTWHFIVFLGICILFLKLIKCYSIVFYSTLKRLASLWWY